MAAWGCTAAWASKYRTVTVGADANSETSKAALRLTELDVQLA